jgi:hypothetical protein
MRRIISNSILLSLISVIMLMQGCSTDQVFVKKDIASISSIKVVRQETPKFQARTLGNVPFV